MGGQSSEPYAQGYSPPIYIQYNGETFYKIDDNAPLVITGEVIIDDKHVHFVEQWQLQKAI